jgi:hypothetical protein
MILPFQSWGVVSVLLWRKNQSVTYQINPLFQFSFVLGSQSQP